MELKEIQNLIKFVSKSGVSEVKLETGDVKITIKTNDNKSLGTTAVVQQVPQQLQVVSGPTATETTPTPVKETGTPADDNYVTIKSPIIGTFYRKPSPDKPNFVDVGKQIQEGDVLCVIEAMKLFNEIESEINGTIVKILVEDSSPIEFDQPLFLVDPS